MQKDGRVLYLTEAKKENQFFNIPIANTSVILLGTGTSITQAAVRMLAQAGVLIGFTGGGGTPLIMGNEVEWLTPQSEYRPTEYLQAWMSFWFDESERFIRAKKIQLQRINYLEMVWKRDRELKIEGFDSSSETVQNIIEKNREQVHIANSISKLLSVEAHLTKDLYKYAARKTNLDLFKRDRDASDKANIFLNHGNYLAYGLAATVLWVLGIPHGFALMHGKTRRGALVFDIADLIKDAIILPNAFICAKENLTEQDFRQQCLQSFIEHKSLDFMFNQVKKLAFPDINLEETTS
jgi:CRISPR-associated protein Cas1